jgi:hypothetical protein
VGAVFTGNGEADAYKKRIAEKHVCVCRCLCCPPADTIIKDIFRPFLEIVLILSDFPRETGVGMPVNKIGGNPNADDRASAKK